MRTKLPSIARARRLFYIALTASHPPRALAAPARLMALRTFRLAPISPVIAPLARSTLPLIDRIGSVRHFSGGGLRAACRSIDATIQSGERGEASARTFAHFDGTQTFSARSTPANSPREDTRGLMGDYLSASRSAESAREGGAPANGAATGGDTIAAVVTAVSSTSGGVAIVRLSGPAAVSIVRRMFRPARKANRARKQGGMARGSGDLGGWAGSAGNGAWGTYTGDFRGEGSEGNELAGSSEEGEGRGGEAMGRSGGSGQGGAAGEWRAESHRVSYGHIVDEQGATIDEVLVLPMLAPRSYTSEDVVEVHCHGGRVCAHSCLATAVHLGARLAGAGDDCPRQLTPLSSRVPHSLHPHMHLLTTPLPPPFVLPELGGFVTGGGEFTLRAFLNGRVDLAQAEAVAALIRADTTAAARSALAAVEGGLSRHIRGVRAACMEVLVDIEARIDFEEDLPPLDAADVSRRIDTIWQQINEALATANRGRLLEYGIQHPSAGSNCGSSQCGQVKLTERAAQLERAIVTDTPGTTRDVVEAQLHLPLSWLQAFSLFSFLPCPRPSILHGVPQQVAIVGRPNVGKSSLLNAWTQSERAIVTDTPGTTRDVVEAQLHLPLSAGGFPVRLADTAGIRHTTDAVEAIGVQRSEAAAAAADVVLVVVSAAEGWTAEDSAIFHRISMQRAVWRRVVTSATLRTGLDDLEATVAAAVGGGLVAEEGQQWAVNQRQQQQLVRAAEAVGRVRESIGAGLALDFWSIDLRSCILALGQVSGEEDVTEEVLSNIFSKFCIGK
ncbi:unnamed protein product [Closterium sp. NIES-65]|nr:unnamed protein product [Closterium sp. NIES-65]